MTNFDFNKDNAQIMAQKRIAAEEAFIWIRNFN